MVKPWECRSSLPTSRRSRYQSGQLPRSPFLDNFRVADNPLGNPRAKGDNHSTSVALADHEIISFQCQLDTLLYYGRSSLPMLPELPITETIDEMIVYHSNGLHVGIHDRRTNGQNQKARQKYESFQIESNGLAITSCGHLIPPRLNHSCRR